MPWRHSVRKDSAAESCSSAESRASRSGARLYRRRTSGRRRNRKSTRLNSSHANISYAVFCLKKKKTSNNPTHLNITSGDPLKTNPRRRRKDRKRAPAREAEKTDALASLATVERQRHLQIPL